MKFGIQIPQSREWWLGKSKDWSIGVILPATSLGYVEYGEEFQPHFLNGWDIDSKWVGFKLNLLTNISLESYEYGKIFTFAIFGLGFRISKYNIKIQ